MTRIYLKETVRHPVSVKDLLKSKIHQNQDKKSLISPGTTTNGDDKEQPLPLKYLMTSRRVILAASNYAFLALVDIAFRALQPVFFSTPVKLGGLGFPPSTIGNILSVSGVISGIFQIFFFAKLHERWGSKKLFIGGIASALPVFASFPVISYLARTQGFSPLLWFVVAGQTVLSVFISVSYGALLFWNFSCQ